MPILLLLSDRHKFVRISSPGISRLSLNIDESHLSRRLKHMPA